MGRNAWGNVEVEQHGIDYVPPEERTGHPWTLLTFWGGATLTLVAASVGGAPVAIGLNFWWALVAIAVGSLVGCLFMAYHSAQGPQLGMPQMIQSRAQFGFYGSLLPVLGALFGYFGALVLAVLIGGPTIQALTGLPKVPSMIITAVVLLLMAWVGYHLFHAFNRVVAVVSLVLFIALAIKLVTIAEVDKLSQGHYSTVALILAITVTASWQITYAVFVSDYSRYLPEETSTRATFIYTYIGAAGGSMFAMIVGALGASLVHGFGADTASGLSGLFPGFGGLILLILFAGLVASNYEAPYGAYLCIMTALSRTGRVMNVVTLRVIVTTVVTVICTVIALLATNDVVSFINNFFSLLLIVLVPWTAINLTDFYLIRHGRYNIAEFFKIDGEYGRFNWPSLVIYVVTLAIEVMFMSVTWYEGPVAHLLGGADVSWLIGLVFAGSAYAAVAHSRGLTGARRTMTPEAAVSGGQE